MKRGYARVSTKDQNLALQINALTLAGCDIRQIYTDKASGKSTLAERPGFAALSAALTSGDDLIVWRLDRLSRDLRDLTGMVSGYQIRGVRLVSITEQLDAGSPAGLLVINVLAAMSQYEWESSRERINAGIAAARETAETWGRPVALAPKAVTSIRRMLADGHRVRDVARHWNVSRSTIRRVLEREGPYG